MSFADKSTPLAPGVVVTIPEIGHQIQCPELSIRQRREHQPLITELSALRTKAVELGKKPEATFDEVQKLQEDLLLVGAKIVKVALERNYPKITDEDLDNFAGSQITDALACALNGPPKPAQGEAPAPAASAMDRVSPFPNGARATSIGTR